MITPQTSIKDLIDFLNNQIQSIDTQAGNINEELLDSSNNNPNRSLKISNEELVLLALLFNKFNRILGTNFTKYADSLLNQVLVKNCKWSIKEFSLSNSFITKNESTNVFFPHFSLLCESIDYSENDYSKFSKITIGINYFKEIHKLLKLDLYKNDLDLNTSSCNLNLNEDEII